MESSIEIDIRFERSGLKSGRNLLESIARETLIHCCEKFDIDQTSISVLFCSREKIQQLNRDFREMDKETDILSFPANEDSAEQMGTESFPAMADDHYLGDLAICMPYVFDDCKREKEDLNRHYPLLLVHGFLHLLGHDHDTKAREKKMFTLQNKIVEELKPWRDLSILQPKKKK